VEHAIITRFRKRSAAVFDFPGGTTCPVYRWLDTAGRGTRRKNHVHRQTAPRPVPMARRAGVWHSFIGSVAEMNWGLQ